jgi:hypothetical protein
MEEQVLSSIDLGGIVNSTIQWIQTLLSPRMERLEKIDQDVLHMYHQKKAIESYNAYVDRYNSALDSALAEHIGEQLSSHPLKDVFFDHYRMQIEVE